MKLAKRIRRKASALTLTGSAALLAASSARADEIADLVTAATTAATTYKTIGGVILGVVVFGVGIKLLKRAGAKV